MNKRQKETIEQLAARDGLTARFDGALVQFGHAKDGEFSPLYGGDGWMTYADAKHLFGGPVLAPGAPKVGDVVKFAKPADADEAAERYVVRELRPARPEIGDTAPDRMLVEAVVDLPIRPRDVVLVSDMVVA